VILLTAIASTGWAAIPDGVRPMAAPTDVVESYAKAFPASAPLACAPLLPEHAHLCFRVWEGKTRRWVTEADLASWQTDREALVQHVAKRSGAVLASELEQQAIPDMDAGYLQLRDGDGWAVAPFFDGPAIEQRLGAMPRVAIPRAGVVLAWPTGSAELDKVMAVAVREMYEAADDAVTPMVHVWRDGRYVPFGVANPTEPDGAGPG
jgi:hypothetical protein